MTLTIFGVVADDLGHVAHHDLEGRSHVSCWPAGDYATRQAARIPVHLQHDGPELGEVLALELRDRHLHAVCVVNLDDADHRDVNTIAGPLYWSPTTTRQGGGEIDLLELSLTDRPAGVGLSPVKILAGDLRSGADRARWPAWSSNDLLAHAVAEDDIRRRHHMPLHVRRARDVRTVGDGVWLVDDQLYGGEQRGPTRGMTVTDGRGQLHVLPVEYGPLVPVHHHRRHR